MKKEEEDLNLSFQIKAEQLGESGRRRKEERGNSAGSIMAYGVAAGASTLSLTPSSEEGAQQPT